MNWAFSLDFHLEYFWGFGPDSFSFDSINRELSNSKTVFSFFTTQQKGKEEELNVYFRVDFFIIFYIFIFQFYFLVLNLRTVQRRVEMDC